MADNPPTAQVTLFGDDEEFHTTWQEWEDMPEFSQDDLTPFATALVHFANQMDLDLFRKLVGQDFPLPINKTANIWFPQVEIGRYRDKRYRSVLP